MYQGSSPNVLRLGQLLELVPATSISDPCPPANGRMQYKPDDAGRQNDGARRDTSFLSEFLRSLMPTYDLVSFKIRKKLISFIRKSKFSM